MKSAREGVWDRAKFIPPMLVEHCHEQAGKRALCSIKSVLATLDRQLAALDQNVDDHLDWYFKDQRTLLDSVKGMGTATILTLTAALPELGRLEHRQIAKLVGIAPGRSQ